MPSMRKKVPTATPSDATRSLWLRFPGPIRKLYSREVNKLDDVDDNVNIPNMDQKQRNTRRPDRTAPTDKASSLTLSELPPGLVWPTDTFSEAHKKYGWDIVKYLDKRWSSILERGRADGRIYATRRILAARDPSAITAIKNYTRPHPVTGERRRIPDRLHFPTLKEVTDERLAEGPKAIRRDPRLLNVVASRLRRGIDIPGW